ncbi:MAG: hypothetical protein PUE84_04655 [Firmicutes bacterium]|nr:hypothetical protein [Bacillota bacterium]
MNRLKTVSRIILIIAIPILIMTLSQNLIYRLPDAYLYYFNDSQCLNKLYLSMSNSEMADALTDLLNRFRPDPETFNIYVDTGYDELGIFDSRDAYNLQMMKKALDMSSLFCIISLILVTAVYVFLLRQEEKKMLRTSFVIGAGISVILMIAQAVVLPAPAMRERIFTVIGVRPFYEDSALSMILTDSFWNMITVFLTGVTLIILGITTYVQYRLTRPPRIFY